MTQLVFFDPKPLKDFEDWKTRRPGAAGPEVSGSLRLPLRQNTDAADTLQLLVRRAGAVHPVAALIPLRLLFIRHRYRSCELTVCIGTRFRLTRTKAKAISFSTSASHEPKHDFWMLKG